MDGAAVSVSQWVARQSGASVFSYEPQFDLNVGDHRSRVFYRTN